MPAGYFPWEVKQDMTLTRTMLSDFQTSRVMNQNKLLTKDSVLGTLLEQYKVD